MLPFSDFRQEAEDFLSTKVPTTVDEALKTIYRMCAKIPKEEVTAVAYLELRDVYFEYPSGHVAVEGVSISADFRRKN